jgi:hypothetical protein
MTFAKRMFLGESVRGNSIGMIKSIKKKRILPNTYIICLAENGIDPLEYLDAVQLMQPYYKKGNDMHICGLAHGKDEAVEVVRRIIETAEEEGSDTVRSFVEGLFE